MALGWVHQAIFRFFAHAGTTNRIRPEDMGLGNYYFGIRYKNPADNLWYYKTTSQVLSYRQNESLSQSITIDVAFDGSGGFVDAPYGTGTVYWDLIVTNTQCPAWTTTAPTVVFKLPSVTIAGVVYVNTGTFIINPWLYCSEMSMNWPSSGYAYIATTIHTSEDSWQIISHPDWLTHHVYRNGTEVTGSNPYIDGDELRLVPGSVNSGDNRSGQVSLGINNASYLNIDVSQEGATPSSSYSFNDYDDHRTLVFNSGSYAILTVGYDSQLTRWKTDSGLGSSFIDVWIRIYDITSHKGTSWHQIVPNSGQSKDGTWNNCWISVDGDLSVQGIVNGHTYSIDITATNPLT
jgi:hypothetical protein